MGRGKNGKGRNEAAMRIHDEWANRLRRMRNEQGSRVNNGRKEAPER